MIRARIFEKDGNRFISSQQAEEVGSTRKVNPLDLVMFCLMAGVKDTHEWLEFEDGAEIRNRPVDMVSRDFAHGSIPLICIAGPLLDESEVEAA